MAGWHHRFEGHEFEQVLGVGDGQGSLICHSAWGHKESYPAERLNWTKLRQRSALRNIPNEKRSITIVNHIFLSFKSSNFKPISTIIFFYFLFIYLFKLYNIVLVLPYIKMNPPQVYMCSPSWTFLPPPSSYHPSGSSQCTSPKHPVSCIEPGLATHFIYGIIHVSMPFSQIIPPSPSPTESKRLFYTSVFLLLSRTQGYCYHLSKFHIYVLVYCIGVFLSG